MRLDHKFPIKSGYLKDGRALEVPVGFISHVSMVYVMRFLMIVSFKGVSMQVAVDIWQMTLSLRDVTL